MQTKMINILKELELKPIKTKGLYHFVEAKVNPNVTIFLRHDSCRKKINIGLKYNRESGLSYNTFYGNSFDSIQLSDHREASALAKDVKRRVLDSTQAKIYIENVEENLQRLKKQNEKEAEIEKDLDKVRKSIGSFYKQGRNLEVKSEHGSVEITCGRLPPEILIQIVKLIDGAKKYE